MANRNLFYQLYNKGNNNYIGVNFTCPDVVDEEDTSFMIQDGDAVIVDSNGDVLQSVSLEDLLASGVSEYHTETKILQPDTTYYIQGMDYGESLAQHWFKFCGHIVDGKEDLFENYINLEFDVCYTLKYSPETLHVSTRDHRDPADGENPESAVDIINSIFCEHDLPLEASMETLDPDSCSGKDRRYLKIASTKLGLELSVTGVACLPIYQSEDYPDSPYQHDAVTVQDVIDALLAVKPGEDKDKVNCAFYIYLLKNLERLFSQVANAGTVTDPGDIPEGFTVQDVIDVIEHIIGVTGLTAVNDNTKYLHRLKEDYDLAVDCLKYPNGAMRGIVIIPEWPDDSDEQKCCLKLHHIKDQLAIYEPVYNVTGDLAGVAEETRLDSFQIFEFAKDGKKIKTLVRYIDEDGKEPVSDVYKIPENWDGRVSSLILARAKKDNSLLKKYDGVDFYYIVNMTVNGRKEQFLVKWINDGHPEYVDEVLYTVPDDWDGRMATLNKVDLAEWDDKYNRPVDLDALPSELYKKLDVEVSDKLPGSEKYKNEYYLRWINDGNGVPEDLYVRVVNESGAVEYAEYIPGTALGTAVQSASSAAAAEASADDSDYVDYVEYPGEADEPACPEYDLLYEKKLYRVVAGYRDAENRSAAKCNYATLSTAADANDAYEKYMEHVKATCTTCYTKKMLEKPKAESCSCYEDPRGIMGYYAYLNWVDENDEWLNIGQGYILVGGDDSEDSNDRNMVPSFLLRNPYDVPVRIRYMVFA